MATKRTKIISAFWQSVAHAPYRGLPWLLWFYVLFCCLCWRHGDGVFTGHIVNFDDNVRMEQIIEWINNSKGMLGGWYDRTIMRTNPPEGFTTIWSRLVDMPFAAIILITQNFVSQKTAALIAAAIMPMLDLAVLFVSAPYFARPLVGKKKSRLILLFLFFSSILNLKYFSYSGFFMGQVSHHAWYIILVTLIFGAAARLAMGSAARAPIVMMGTAIAMANLVGIETYPIIAGAAGVLAFLAWFDNRPVLAGRAGTALLCGAFGTLLLLPIHRSPHEFFVISFNQPSIFGAILTMVAALFLKTEQVILQAWGKNKNNSAFALCLAGAVIASVFIIVFPDIIDGAAAGLSPAEREMAKREHYEAWSIWRASTDLFDFVGLAMPILIALVTGAYAVRKAHGMRRRAVALCYLGFAAVGGGMSGLFSRYYHHAMTTASAWLLWAWEEAKRRMPKHAPCYALASFFLLGPLWMWLVPGIDRDAPLVTQMLMFPAGAEVTADPFDILSMADYLNKHYDKNTLLIVPHGWSGHYLYETHLRIDFLANYPSQDKFIENYAFYNTTEPEMARDIARRHGFDLVMMYKVQKFFHPEIPKELQPFAARLAQYDPPRWLKLVKGTPADSNFILYEVDKKALNDGEP